MIILILTIILGIIGALRIDNDYSYLNSFTTTAYVSLKIVVGAIAGFFVGMLLAIIISRVFPPDSNTATKVVLSNQEIVSLSDNSTVHGKFFLGCGNIKGSMSYVYYTKHEDAYQMEVTDYKDVNIRFTNSTPYVETYIYIYSRKGILKYIAYDNKCVNTTIYVPKGTIKFNYNLDTE